jgi:hypothetical protein
MLMPTMVALDHGWCFPLGGIAMVPSPPVLVFGLFFWWSTLSIFGLWVGSASAWLGLAWMSER